MSKVERGVDDFFNLSGSKFNTVRPSSQPLAMKTLDMTGAATELHIDLNNMEDPKFEDSQYVLTSPRSLEACSRLAIKPVELLHKPLREFQEELLPKGIALKTVYALYDEKERERLDKMVLCRELRNKLILEDVESGSSYVSPLIVTHPSQTKRAWEEKPTRDCGNTPVNQSDEENIEPASLQRKRTALTMSVGHDRVSAKELEKRIQDIQDKSMKLRETILQDTNRQRKPKPYRKPKKKVIIADHRKHRRKPTRESDQRMPNTSCSDLSVASSGASSRISWLRDPRSEARPISDTKLRRRLTSGGSARVTTKLPFGSPLDRYKSLPNISRTDEKILQRMLAKREEEEEMNHHRIKSQTSWPGHSPVNGDDPRERRHTMIESKKQKERRRMAVEARRRQEEEAIVRQKEENAEKQLKHWQMNQEKQRLLREQKIIEQRHKSMQRKKSQEERKIQKEEKEKHQKEVAKERQQVSLQRAHSMRSARDQQQRKEKKLRSYYTKKKHEERWQELQQQYSDDLDNLRSAMDMRHSAVMSNRDLTRRQKEHEIHLSQRELDKKIRKTRELQKQMEEEMHMWQDELQTYRKLTEERASEVATKNTLEKKKKAQKERERWEQQQRNNMKRLLSQEETWREEIEAELALKDAKSRAVMQDKAEAIAEYRELARSSQRLRDELRRQYSTGKIKDMDKQAQLEARVGAGVRSATKNMSTLTLG